MVSAAEFVVAFQLFFRHALFEVPPVAAHEGALLPFGADECVAMEVLERGCYHFLDKDLVFADEFFDFVGFLCFGRLTEAQEGDEQWQDSFHG